MRNAIYLQMLLILFLFSCQTPNKTELYKYPEPKRVQGQADVLQLRCDPIDTVKVGFIGIGSRGMGALERFLHIDGAKIAAICDIESGKVDMAKNFLKQKGVLKLDEYSGNENEWRKLCENPDIDLVYICTQWDLHTPMAVYAMECGKHVAIEVPAAMTIEECWKLVDTAERTRKHCMMLENCCYDFFEMATLNMAQKGILGEIVHAEGAYIHDLRAECFDDKVYFDMWRLKHNTIHNGNPYPTHGLGPLCQILNIHRGDKMNYLVSMSTQQFGMSEFANEKYGSDHEMAKKDYQLGDMNTTLIHTQKGKTIMIQHDVTSPRPYSRIHLISGTKGFAQKWPVTKVALSPDSHNFLSDDDMAALLSEYEHPISKEIGEKARQVGGHGGMDYIMDYRLIYCLRHGLPLDQDVYDAAEWCALVELSEFSVRNKSIPVKIPDFTRGAWDKVEGFQLAL